MLQRIGSIGLALHLGLVFLHNIGNIPLAAPDAKSAMDPIFHFLQQVPSQPGLCQYVQLAGLHGCYGFYGPQVGSIYSSRFEIHDQNKETILTLSYPGLRYTASKIRYSSILEALEGWRPTGDQSKSPLFARANVHSLYKYVQRLYPDNQVQLLIYSIRIPSLSEIRTKKQAHKLIIPIYEQPSQKKHFL